MRYLNITALPATSDLSNGTLTGITIGEEGVWLASVQAFFDVTVAGTLHLQGSNDIPQNGYPVGQFTPTYWTDVATPVTVTAGGTTALFPATQVCYRFLRVVFVVTTPGTSTVTANFCGWSD